MSILPIIFIQTIIILYETINVTQYRSLYQIPIPKTRLRKYRYKDRKFKIRLSVVSTQQQVSV
jgi:hypothetical protein